MKNADFLELTNNFETKTVKCLSGYLFPNGEVYQKFKCVDGIWKSEDQGKSPSEYYCRKADDDFHCICDVCVLDEPCVYSMQWKSKNH